MLFGTGSYRWGNPGSELMRRGGLLDWLRMQNQRRPAFAGKPAPQYSIFNAMADSGMDMRKVQAMGPMLAMASRQGGMGAMLQAGGLGGGVAGTGMLQNMIQQFQQMHDKANAANEARYAQINQGYDNRYNEAMRLADVAKQQDYRHKIAAANQDLVNRGLRASTLAGKAASQAYETSAQIPLSVHNSLSGDKLAFMERKNEVGPDLGMMAQLAMTGANNEAQNSMLQQQLAMINGLYGGGGGVNGFGGLGGFGNGIGNSPFSGIGMNQFFQQPSPINLGVMSPSYRSPASMGYNIPQFQLPGPGGYRQTPGGYGGSFNPARYQQNLQETLNRRARLSGGRNQIVNQSQSGNGFGNAIWQGLGQIPSSLMQGVSQGAGWMNGLGPLMNALAMLGLTGR